MSDTSLYDKLREIQADGNHRINILQESIDLEVQMSYFKCTTRVKKNLEKDVNYLEQTVQLYDPEVDIELKKILLCTLASFENPECFRAIEQFQEFAPKDLKEWTTLALQESKMLLESTLLDTKLLYISTGLGGKGSALRFFLVLITSNEEYSAQQAAIVEKEFEFYFRKHDGEIEEVRFEDKYACIVCILPLNCNIEHVIRTTIEECNTYGNFIEKNFLLTNVKKLNVEEITEFLQKNTEEKPIQTDLDWDADNSV